MEEHLRCGSLGSLAHWILPGQPGFLDVVIVLSTATVNSREKYSFFIPHDYFILSLYLCIMNLSVFVHTSTVFVSLL